MEEIEMKQQRKGS